MTLEEELAEFERRQKELEKAFADMDAAFQKWKEEVLKFEHVEYCSDDDPDGDDRICDGECIWSGESESDDQRSLEQNNSEPEDDNGEEGEKG